jgi:predicted nucleic acid-binding protein
MIDYVIDANVLMGILISGKAAYRPILGYYRFIVPEFALTEIDKYSPLIINKTKMSEEKLFQWTHFVFSQITVLPKYSHDRDCLAKANRLLEKIDLKDISYVALSIQLDLVLLTRDEQLISGLKKQGFRKVLNFTEFVKGV